MSEADFRTILTDHAIARKTPLEAKAALLQLFPGTETPSQVAILSEYVEAILLDTRYGETPIDIAVRGLAEMAMAGFVVHHG